MERILQQRGNTTTFKFRSFQNLLYLTFAKTIAENLSSVAVDADGIRLFQIEHSRMKWIMIAESCTLSLVIFHLALLLPDQHHRCILPHATPTYADFHRPIFFSQSQFLGSSVHHYLIFPRPNSPHAVIPHPLLFFLILISFSFQSFLILPYSASPHSVVPQCISSHHNLPCPYLILHR